MARKKPANPHLFLLLLLCFGLLTAAVVVWHATAPLDNVIMHALFAARSGAGVTFFTFVTGFGDTFPVFGVLAAALIVLLISRHQKGYAVGLLLAVLGAKACEVIIKVAVERPRPTDMLPLFHLDTFSFPSGHATGAMALYGFITYLLCSIYPKWRVPAALLGGSIIFLIGLSRMYLWVHFPSDVLAGYLLGAIWICIGIGTVRYMRS